MGVLSYQPKKNSVLTNPYKNEPRYKIENLKNLKNPGIFFLKKKHVHMEIFQQFSRWMMYFHAMLVKFTIYPWTPKTMKNEGFKPSEYGLWTLKMKVMVSHGSI